MIYTLTRRAILIALLLFTSPFLSAGEDQSSNYGNSKNVSAVTGTQNSATIAPKIPESTDKSFGDELEANPNKEKLTVFFGIGLVINIVMMSLFAFWAIRQWRKSNNPRGKQ